MPAAKKNNPAGLKYVQIAPDIKKAYPAKVPDGPKKLSILLLITIIWKKHTFNCNILRIARNQTEAKVSKNWIYEFIFKDRFSPVRKTD